MKIRDTANFMFLMTLLIYYFRLMPPEDPFHRKCGPVDYFLTMILMKHGSKSKRIIPTLKQNSS